MYVCIDVGVVRRIQWSIRRNKRVEHRHPVFSRFLVTVMDVVTLSGPYVIITLTFDTLTTPLGPKSLTKELDPQHWILI